MILPHPLPFIMEEFFFDYLVLVTAGQVQTPEFSRRRDGEQLQTCTAHQWAICVLCELRDHRIVLYVTYTQLSHSVLT